MSLRNWQENNMTQFLDIEEVYRIHDQMIKIGGGKNGVRDFTLLHSAIERPKATFAGHSLYSSIWLKAAALFHSLVKNHGFYDGNKRTAFFSTLLFLKKNYFQLKPLKKEIIRFTLGIDVSNLDIETIAEWLKKHSKKIGVDK